MGDSWETFPCLTRDLLVPQDCHSLTEIPQRLQRLVRVNANSSALGVLFPQSGCIWLRGATAFSILLSRSPFCHPEDPGGQLELHPIQGSSSCIPESRTCCCLALPGLSTVTSMVLEGPGRSS